MRGMRLGEAKRACPELVILPSDYELYSIYSQRVFHIIRRFTPDVEEYSIDEAFCDLTGLRRIYRGSYPAIARSIKEAIQKELDLTVSVGLSLSKTLAKLCSKQNKPDGFLAVPGSQLHTLLAAMPLERVCGFGPNTVALLNKCGIANVLDYVKKPREFAEKLLGKIGVELWLELRGMPVYPISTEKKEKYLSISKTKTFMPASSSRDFVKGQLMRNLESACIKLRRHKLAAKTLVVYLRKSDFTSAGLEGSINRHSSSTLDFTDLCARLFAGAFEANAAYRATGVILAEIAPAGTDTQDLFEDPLRIERIQKVSAAVDHINASFGKHAIHVASAHVVSKKGSHPRNHLAWRKTRTLERGNLPQAPGDPAA